MARNVSIFVGRAATITSLAALSILGAQIPASDAGAVTDPVLRECINETLGNPSGTPVRSDELKELRSLTCESQNLSSLDGLEFAHSLRELSLPVEDTRIHCGDRKGIDLEPLSGLTQLEVLKLECLGLRDISTLANLTRLTKLSLFGNPVSDVSPLADLTALSNLSLINAEVTDLSPLSNLSSLKFLSVDSNLVTDTSPLSALKQLIFLSLSNTQISDLEPLSRLYAIETLSLSRNLITDISPLARLGSLQTLDFSGNQVTDISPLLPLQNLSSLDANDQEIELPPARIGDQLPIEIRGLQGTLISPDTDQYVQADEQNITPQKHGRVGASWQESTMHGLFGKSFSGTVWVEVAAPSPVWKWLGIGSIVAVLLAGIFWLRLLAHKRDRALAQALAQESGFKPPIPLLESVEPPRVDVHYEWTQHALWLSGRCDYDSVDGHEIGLSPELVQDLRAWCAAEDALFDGDDPPNSGSTDGYLEKGFALAKRVRAELPPEWVVTADDPITLKNVVLPLES